MTPAQAVAFVRDHGIVLESARGPVPSLAEWIAGGPIEGSWWAHPKGGEIFRLTRAVRADEHTLVCRLVNGKITFVHRRLWSSLVAAAKHFPERDLALLRERHTKSGQHAVEETPFPKWVPVSVAREAEELDAATALTRLGMPARRKEV